MPRTITIEDTVSFKSVSNAEIHPDGDLIVFTVSEPFVDGSAFPRANIWAVPSDGGEPRALHVGPNVGRDASVVARWDPAGVPVGS